MEIVKSLTSMPDKQRAAAKYLAGFFALMVLLTFLSRAADSFTVPTVKTEKLSSGALEHKVSAEGSLYPRSQIAVAAPAGYRILSLHVEQGRQVKAGDKLATLDTEQIQDQLNAAQAELKKLRLLAAADAIDIAEDEDGNGMEAAQKALDRAQVDLETAEKESSLQVSGAQDTLSTARKALRELEDEGATDAEIDAARDVIRQQYRELSEAYLSQDKALEAANRAIEDAETQLAQAAKDADKAGEKSAAETQRKGLEREAANVGIQLGQQKVDELTALLETQGILTADIGGVITRITGEVGSVTSEESLFVLSDSSAGLQFRANVDKNALKHIQRGDSARVTLTGESRIIEDAVIESIAPTAAEDGSYGVVATLPAGNWEPGTSGKMTVSQKTAQYRQCVINGAVRRDNSGDFVLVLRETKGILGTQTVAERVNVNVLERDDNRSAIEAPLEGSDQIIVSGSRPISDGDRVRA